MYSIVRESTIILSPLSIKGGTWIFNPFANTAGLYEDETVWPFKATSVLSTVHIIWFGKLTDSGFSL